mgnify:CR=1 FL=1
MAIVNRNTLKNFFKKGGFAKENHFVDLIDSTINSVDDGIQINIDGNNYYWAGGGGGR